MINDYYAYFCCSNCAHLIGEPALHVSDAFRTRSPAIPRVAWCLHPASRYQFPRTDISPCERANLVMYDRETSAALELRGRYRSRDRFPIVRYLNIAR